MRAFVLLCLLGEAMGSLDRYSWNGPGTPAPSGKESMNNECLTDQSSCGCCVMRQQMYKMEMFLNMSLGELEKGLERTEQILKNITESRSAFSAALTNDRWCLGPFREEEGIIYKHVFINLGNDYNVNTGVFTVPRCGVYSLSLTVYSDSGAPGNTLSSCAALTVNGNVVAGPSDKNNQDQEDSATTVLALHLKAGDKVAVYLPIGCFLCDNNSHFNTFSGFLLYATD
ncbi:cerebellin 20 [Polymixia lowei]